MYRVIKWEDASETIAGLTIEEAAKHRLRLAGIRHEFRLLDGEDTLTLFMAPRRTTISDPGGHLLPVRKATYRDRRNAEQELCQWIADAPLPSPYVVVTDREYALSEREVADDTERSTAISDRQ